MRKLFLLLALLVTIDAGAQSIQYGRFHKSLFGSADPAAVTCQNGTLYWGSTNDKLFVCENNVWTTAGATLTSPVFSTSVVLKQTTADYTFTWANPAAARAISIVDPLGTDVFVWRAAAQTLVAKTLTSPVLNTGTVGTSLASVTAGSATLGTAALPFSSAYIGAAATNNIQLTGTATTAKVVTFADATGTVPLAVFADCGTSAACSSTTISSSVKVVTGSVALVSATPSQATVTALSPAFTSSTSYRCSATPVGTTAAIAAGGVAVSYVSGTSFTLTGPSTVSTVINYICIGN